MIGMTMQVKTLLTIWAAISVLTLVKLTKTLLKAVILVLILGALLYYACSTGQLTFNL